LVGKVKEVICMAKKRPVRKVRRPKVRRPEF